MQLHRSCKSSDGNVTSKMLESSTMTSTAVQNRSFLHGDIIGEKFATIDSVALRRTSLPLQLVPTDINLIDDGPDDEDSDNKITADCPLALLQLSKMLLKDCPCSNEVKEITTGTTESGADITNKADIDTDDVLRQDMQVSWEIKSATNFDREVVRTKRRSSSINGGKFVIKPRWTFARSVLHYVPKRKIRTTKFTKTAGKSVDKCADKSVNSRRSVSIPTDFVHVAGITRWSWLNESNLTAHSPRIITHKEKCATLTLISDNQDEQDSCTRSSSLETLVNDIGVEPVKQPTVSPPVATLQSQELVRQNDEFHVSSSKPLANTSFLWSNISKCTDDDKKTEKFHDIEDYDDVGPVVNEADEMYDDVGAPSSFGNGLPLSNDYHEDDDQVYDDVMPPSFGSSCQLPEMLEKDLDNISQHVELRNKEVSTSSSMSVKEFSCSRKELDNEEEEFIYMSNNYSLVDGDADDEDALYDDVGICCESRVNSIYAGSYIATQLDQSKESEWEDLEETSSNDASKNNSQVIVKSNAEISKKKSGQRWTRKVRRQRSKASRRNSVRSSNRVSRQSCNFSVAVSLGTGSVLLVGPTEGGTVATEKWRNSCRLNLVDSDRSTRGLVQLRTVDRHEASMDTQETSCYVLEDTGSDDSNYETLCSFEPTETNVDNDNWPRNSTKCVNFVEPEQINEVVRCLQPPSRPVPPPPRESSLTETFGKRMKILKRTWSITKGSLGRMRRRTSMSTESDSNIDDTSQKSNNFDNNHHHDGRKSSQVFNFRKHFQKSITSLSTFYLDNENEITSSRNNNTSMDDIYGNSNWFVHSNCETRQDNNADDYNILAEEPLYQFYAAATVSNAFQSDSDSYEETEDSTSLASSSELGKPGHRTLWCQTPQVIGSGLLERLTPDEKKLQEAKFEILTSEASYLNSLRVLVNEYVINHELVYEALSASDREKLFGNVPSVLIASERLLAELETAWRADPMLRGIPEVLLYHAERCSKVYVEYCSNQVSIDLTLKELKSKKSSKFIETIARIEAHPACQSLTLHSFLMLPMQRITRLPLLADAVLSKLSTDHEERLDWEKVLSVLGRVVTECNEGARAAGRQIEMASLARKIEYTPKVPPIDLKDRYLVRSGPVTQMLAKPGSEYVLTFRKKYSKTPLYLLLLTDHLLVAKLKTNGQEETYSVIDSSKRSLIAMEKVPDDSPFAGRYSVILTLLENHCGKHVEYVLSCQNDTERERWLDAVSPPKPNVVGETLYETWDCPQVMALYSYTASQPDELSLQPGDVINVLRKMADGWNVGEKLVGGEQGWFPGNYTKEVASEHVRARNLRQRHRLLALSESLVQQRAKLTSGINR